MGVDPRPEMPRHHLGAEAEAEIGRSSLSGTLDPVDLALDEVVLVVGAHRAAEDHGAGMLRHRVGQRIAEARPADVERMAALPQQAPDAARRRVLLVQDDEDRELFPVRRLRHSPLRKSLGHEDGICR